MSVFEKHYSVQELAKLWHLSDDKIRELFADEPDVLKVGSPTQQIGRKYKRRYYTLRIPESVAIKIHARLLSKRSARM